MTNLFAVISTVQHWQASTKLDSCPNNIHLSHAFIHVRALRQVVQLGGRQLDHAALALLRSHLRAHNLQLLLRERGFLLDLDEQLSTQC